MQGPRESSGRCNLYLPNTPQAAHSRCCLGGRESPPAWWHRWCQSPLFMQRRQFVTWGLHGGLCRDSAASGTRGTALHPFTYWQRLWSSWNNEEVVSIYFGGCNCELANKLGCFCPLVVRTPLWSGGDHRNPSEYSRILRKKCSLRLFRPHFKITGVTVGIPNWTVRRFSSK